MQRVRRYSPWLVALLRALQLGKNLFKLHIARSGGFAKLFSELRCLFGSSGLFCRHGQIESDLPRRGTRSENAVQHFVSLLGAALSYQRAGEFAVCRFATGE